MKHKQQKTAFSLAVVANVMWASSFIGSKYTLLSWGPYTAVLLRFILSFAVLLISYKLFEIKIEVPKSPKHWLYIATIGLILGVLYPLQLSGLVYLSSGTSAAIMLLAPLILVVLAPFITRESIEPQKMLAIVLGIFGGLILLYKNVSFSKDTEVGTWLTFGAAACLAVFTLINRKFSNLVTHPAMTLYSFGVGAIVVAPFAYFEPSRLVTGSTANLPTSLWALIYLAIACTAIPFFIWNRATAMTETKNLASTMHVKTPVAIILGVLIFHESLTWQIVIGTLIVSLALWLSQAENIFLILKNLKGGIDHERKPMGNAVSR